MNAPAPATPKQAARPRPLKAAKKGAAAPEPLEEAEADSEPVAMPAAPPADPATSTLGPKGGGKGRGYGSGSGGKRKSDASVDGRRLEDKERQRVADDWRAPRRPPTSIIQLATCSDISKRPLAHRVLLWKKRLKTAKSAQELLERYETARRACELPDWRAERTFLKLLQERVGSEGDAVQVLRYFAWRPDVQKYIGKLILRRVVDDRIVAAVERALFGGRVDWNGVDLELQAIEDLDARIAKLRELMAKAPDDPNGDIRLVKLYVKAGKAPEALAHGRRLRDQGFLTLRIARQLGDVLARSEQEAEAVRTYSEIVEFDPESVASRQLLGDIYLSRGWYEPAYRQYKTTTELAPNEPLGFLRLAAAAAGTGRIDEALRLERKVATAQGRPGPNDPRRWARLWSAARLSRLLAEPPKGQPAVKPAAIKRKLKELSLYRGPATLVVLPREDLSSQVVLTAEVGDESMALGETTDAGPVGLYASLLGPEQLAKATLAARLRTTPREEKLGLWRHDIAWNGKDFTVTVQRATLDPEQTEAKL